MAAVSNATGLAGDVFSRGAAVEAYICTVRAFVFVN